MSAQNIVEPGKAKEAFTCPNCGAYAKFDWFVLNAIGQLGGGVIHHEAARCHHCSMMTLWAAVETERPGPVMKGRSSSATGYEYRLVYPRKMTAPRQHDDLPEEC